MTPRNFLNYFKTKSGKLVLFAIIFIAGLLLLSAIRDRARVGSQMEAANATHAANSQTDKPQIVQSVERPMQPFRPPPAKPDPSNPNQTPPPMANDIAKNDPPSHTPPEPKEPSPKPLAPISLLADATAGIAEPKSLSSVFAPFGRLISCETVITVDSSSIQTPIVGLVIEDVYHAGKLVIPAGTEVHGMAQTDRHRERIASGTSWTFVWQTGEELHLKAIALDREFSGNQEGWGITDGSAGLRGRVIKTDNMAEIKLFAATFLAGAANALTEKQQTVFGPINSPSLNNAPFEGAQQVLSVYAQHIYDAIQRDGFYVRVPSGKQFYLYVLQTIDRADAAVGGSAEPFVDQEKSSLVTSPEPPSSRSH
jgi:hypothetical protein